MDGLDSDRVVEGDAPESLPIATAAPDHAAAASASPSNAQPAPVVNNFNFFGSAHPDMSTLFGAVLPTPPVPLAGTPPQAGNIGPIRAHVTQSRRGRGRPSNVQNMVSRLQAMGYNISGSPGVGPAPPMPPIPAPAPAPAPALPSFLRSLATPAQNRQQAAPPPAEQSAPQPATSQVVPEHLCCVCRCERMKGVLTCGHLLCETCYFNIGGTMVCPVPYCLKSFSAVGGFIMIHDTP